MTVRKLDHVNILSLKYEETLAFYRDLFDMKVGPTPVNDVSRGAWIYDDDDRPVVHLGTYEARYPTDEIMPQGKEPSRGGGAINHVALECTGYDEIVASLQAANHPLAFSNIPSISLRQVFVEDPNGITLELNFRGAAAG